MGFLYGAFAFIIAFIISVLAFWLSMTISPQGFLEVPSWLIVVLVGPLTNFFLLKKFKIKRPLLITVIETVVMVAIGFIVVFTIIGILNSLTKPNNPADVQKVYAQTSVSMADTFARNGGGTEFAMQTQHTTQFTTETNENKQLYCFFTPASNTVVGNLVSDFMKQNNAQWYPDAVSNNQTFVDYNSLSPSAYVGLLQSQLNSNGQVTVSFTTNNANPIKTTNPSYYPSGIADLTVSNPQVVNQCSQLAATKKIRLVGSMIISLSIDLSDTEPQF